MKRVHLFELEDQPWLPASIRNGMVDCLRFFFTQLKLYSGSAKAIVELMQHSGQQQVLDLGSGGGGGIMEVARQLNIQTGKPIPIRLSDKFPNLAAFEYLQEQSNGQVSYYPQSIDATAVPGKLPGVRTLYTAFHHFRPEQAQDILRKAAENGTAIGIFEGTARHPLNLLLVMPLPLLVLLATPFIQPFRWSRLLWTYVLPAIPLGVFWDGLASMLRLYSEPELRKMTETAKMPDYKWEIRRERHWLGVKTVQILGWAETSNQG
jgi:hypothetical protein